jgi:hypothetical protein
MGTLIRLSERSANRSDVPDTNQIETASMPAAPFRNQIVAAARTGDALNQIIDAVQSNLKILDGLAVRIGDEEKRETLRRKLGSLAMSLQRNAAKLQASNKLLENIGRLPAP